jgi:hypothetical protein
LPNGRLPEVFTEDYMQILKQIKFQYVTVTALLLVSLLYLSAQKPSSREYQIKAVFLFNFTQFVEWPSNALQPNAPLVIGILGEDFFGAYLEEIISGEKVNGHPLIIQRYRQVEEIKTCHILFISQSEKGRIEAITSGLKRRSILTVSDVDSFIKEGGMIRFYTVDNKIQLRVNPDGAKEANLVISSKLLRLAQIVKK